MSRIDKFFSYLLGNDRQKYEEVNIDQEVLDEIMEISRESYPNEFVALLQGKIRDSILHIDGLIFLPGETSSEGAVMKVFMLPPMSGSVGSVHSHPGYSNQPSQADYHFFAKNGLFHMIIAEPYTRDTIASFNAFGEEINFNVV
jgi:proteasome lid subunit RPN8/RPN11